MTLDQVFNAVFAVLILVAVGLWFRAIRQVRGGEPVVPHHRRRVPRFGLLDVFLLFACWLWGQMLVLGWAGGGGELDLARLDELAADQKAAMVGLIAIGQLAGTLVGLMWVGWRYRNLSLLRFSTEQIREGFRLGTWAFLLVVPPILLLQLGLSQWVPYQHATLEGLNSLSPWQSFVLTWFGAVLVAPICEEFFFRGILQDWLLRFFRGQGATAESLLLGAREGLPEEACPVEAGSSEGWSVGLAIGVGALMFGLVHWGQGLAPIPLFFLGLALGYLYYRTGNIISCLVLHGLLNSFSMFWYTLRVLVAA